MTVPAQTPINRHTANGVTTVFSFTFKVLSADDLEVSVGGAVQTTGFTVSGVGANTGAVTFTTAPANGAVVVLRRVMAIQRTTDYQDQGAMPAATVDDDHDAAVMMVQQVAAVQASALQYPVLEGISGTLPAAADRAGKLLGFNSLGLPTVSAPASGSAAELALDLASTASGKGAEMVAFKQAGTGAVDRTAADKLREAVSVKDFGAVGDWNGVAGTDNTAALQAAFNYCTSTGSKLDFPSGRYRTTAPLVIDRTFNNQDPINGGMYGISLRGGGAASSQIVADHNGACIDFRGGPGAGWHTYFYIDGVGLLKANQARNTGSIGLKIDAAAYMQVQRFDIYGFEYGIYGTDVLSSEFMDGTIRGNEYGFRFQKGTRSHPNNISFRGIKTLNNITYGGALYRPSVFSYIGGSIESNGYTGVLSDPNSWGLYVESAGTEGSVGINMQGVYMENNNGKADVWILQTLNNVIHNFNGCSFLRFLDTRYVTNCILFNSTNESRVALSGCGFKDYAPYVSSGARAWIGSGDAQILDSGNNFFHDTAGGFTGLARAVFAPIAANHQLPFSSLPLATKFRNAIQYCVDGTGSTLPSLAVSDGVKWWQIPLGIFGGRVSSAGASIKLPRGWTCSRSSSGVYVVTHNLSLAVDTYSVTATPSGAPGRGYCSGMVLSGNSFEVYFANQAGAATDMDFSFVMNII